MITTATDAPLVMVADLGLLVAIYQRLFSLLCSKAMKGIDIADVVIGTGAEVSKGDIAVVHLVGKLNRGDVFWDTRKSGMPTEVEVGGRKGVAGLMKGIAGMRVGGKRTLRISPHLAYGSKGWSFVGGFQQLPIPGDAVLNFEVDLLDVRR